LVPVRLERGRGARALARSCENFGESAVGEGVDRRAKIEPRIVEREPSRCAAGVVERLLECQ
jgi:hypothetical protein